MHFDLVPLKYAILKDPTNLQVRAAYADCLMENGFQERGDFIKKSLETQKITTVFNFDNQWWLGERRCEGSSDNYFVKIDLLKCLWYDFPLGCFGARKITLRNGFINSLHIKHNDFVENAEVFFTNHPIEQVVLTDLVSLVCGESFSLYCSFDNCKQFAPSLYYYLPGEETYKLGVGWCKIYKSMLALTEAVSVACVAFGRNAVGL